MNVKPSMRIVTSAALLAGLLGGATPGPAPAQAHSTITAKKKPKVQIDKGCRKQFRLKTGELQIAMDSTIAVWEGWKRAAETDIADMRRTIADPQQYVSIDALKSAAVVKARNVIPVLEEQRDNNLDDVKAFEKRFSKCFSTPEGKKAFAGAVGFVRAGFKEMATAEYRIQNVWLDLSSADVATADLDIQKTLVDVMAAEPTFDRGMSQLGKMD